jgi:hypothetical protein
MLAQVEVPKSNSFTIAWQLSGKSHTLYKGIEFIL